MTRETVRKVLIFTEMQEAANEWLACTRRPESFDSFQIDYSALKKLAENDQEFFNAFVELSDRFVKKYDKLIEDL